MWLKTGTIPNQVKKTKNNQEERKGGENGCEKGGVKMGRNRTAQMSMKSGSQITLQHPAVKV